MSGQTDLHKFTDATVMGASFCGYDDIGVSRMFL